MDMPIGLRSAIETAAAEFNFAQLKDAARTLTERYKSESGQGKRLVTKELETAAYAAVRMPATFGAVSSALSYAFELFDGEIESVLDVGAGTGAASFAALSVLDTDLKITCIEREQSMIDFGRKIASSDISFAKAKWIQKDFSKAEISEKADLVISSYAMNELSGEDRERLLKLLWNAADKMLLIVEPGTPVGFEQIRKAKEFLTAAGGFTVAPCPGNEACPIEGDNWCHFTARVSRSKLHKMLKDGDVPYEDEKFSYIAVSKIPCATAPKRVLRHPVKDPGRISPELCPRAGLITQTVMKKEKDAFKKARKLSCGDMFDA
ncbi:MAG: small ribosomal subunit Rsm22 family protein [Lachnospiraceae bacterium]|nr:small ribosomal subunit Rsm22 family protein [Lachnospiraceae bacterium]